MAEKRMFAKTIIDSDLFLDMPASTQLLYFHLAMRADDDGFVNSPKKIQRMIGCSDDDIRILISKQFIIPFESGIVVIKHWKIHNYIRKDTYNETRYLEEKKHLVVDEDKTYQVVINSECTPTVDGSSTERLPFVDTDKISSGKVSEDKNSNLPDKSDGACSSSGTQKKGKSKVPKYPEEYEKIISYLNEKAGTSYRPSATSNQKHINARLNEGYNIDDFIKVIDVKCFEWKGTDMEKYLRPETLFGNKFESYLNQKISQRSEEEYESVFRSSDPNDAPF